jgi:hypothetical protein
MATTQESADMANPGPAGLFDREIDLDPARVRAGRPRRSHGAIPIQRFQRLLANPFLGATGIVAWVALMRKVVEYQRIDLTVVVLLLVVPLGYLFQYHCLDCGATALVTRWRSHRCAAVELRRASGRGRFLHGPTPMVQTVLWVFFLFICLVIILASSTRPF